MGIAEIQAALAQGAPASANPFAAPASQAAQVQAFAVQPIAAPPQAPAFQPSPFAAPATAAPNPFGGSAPAQVVPAAPAFTPSPFGLATPTPQVQVAEVRTGGPGKLGISFTPPAPAATAAPFAFNPPPGFNPATTPPINPPGERASLNSPAPEPAPTAPAVEAPAPTEPKRRTRKPKAEPAITITAQTGVQAVDLGTIGGSDELASPAEVVLGSISTEDLVAVLRERGYSVWLEAKS